MRKNESPTLVQIELVDDICGALGITTFPNNSSQFTKFIYQKFIDTFIDEYNYARAEQDGRQEVTFYC